MPVARLLEAVRRVQQASLRKIVADELQAGIVCSGMNGGTHEKTLEMMQLFAEEVMPYFREDAHVDETVGVGR